MSTGCVVCRSRKVRCDRNTPACHNCTRLGVNCPGYSDTTATLSQRDGSRQRLQDSVDFIYRASGVEKRRVGSCDECRRTKSRCSRTRPVCKRCTRKGFMCKYNAKYDAPAADTAASPSPQPTMAAEASMLPAPSNGSGLVSAPGSQSSTMAVPIPQHMHWAYSDTLPQGKFHMQGLADLFFDRMSTLRCLGFIHKPTFFQALDRGTLKEDFGEAVVYIVAALGARMYLLVDPAPFNNPFIGVPGAAWADRARDLALREIANPSLSTMMAMVLICEYSIFMDQHALAFVIFGCCVRIMRLLGLDSPKKAVVPSGLAHMTHLETERRLLWSCYLMDSFLGGGVDGNLYWKDDFPCVPLPCSDASFIAQEQYADFEAPKLSEFELYPDRNYLNLRSHTIYLVQLRTRVLRLIRNNNQQVNIWDPGSPFLDIIQRLEIWYAGLPERLVISDFNVYIHKELNTINAVFMLHFLYHSIVCDLTRVSLPGYVFPLSAAFQSCPLEFRRQCQERCRFHADEISRLVHAGFGYGIQAFDDLHSLMATFESTKIQIIHTATATSNSVDIRERTAHNIRLNMRVLDVLHLQKDKPNPYHKALIPLLEKFDFNNVVAEWQAYPSPMSMDSEQAEVTGPEDTGYLSSLAPFRLAKEEIHAQTRQQRGSSPARNDLPDSPAMARPPPIISLPHKDALGGIGGADGNAGLLRSASFSLAPMQLASTAHPTPPGLDVAAEIQGVVAKEMVNLSDLSEDYIRMASEMANYISWDISEPQPWLDFDISSNNI
ncbi:hypothetical protein ACQKWADRAFT_305390 [Trichoderma austrokoningii]